MAYSTFSSKALHTHLHASDSSPLSACETDLYLEEGSLDDSYLFDHDPKDFNNAEPQRQGFDLIPHGTILRVRMALNPGDQRDIRSPWREEGCATQNPQTGSVYLACEYTVCEDGPYYRQKIWGRIGLHSNKSPKWAMIGRSFMRGILESAYGIDKDDKTERATGLRKLRQYRQLHGLEFVARIDVEVDLDKNKSYNVIKVAITRGHKDYENHTGYGTGVSSYQSVNR